MVRTQGSRWKAKGVRVGGGGGGGGGGWAVF